MTEAEWMSREHLPDIEGPYGETKDAAEARKRAEAAPPVALTFDIVWVDPDRSPTMFIGITGSGIENGFLTLNADRITHLVNTSQIAHVNIWQEHTDE